ncbi:MAG: hypothetical protein LBQ38_12770 [Spirochaetaceae bacterium]|jgi:hypothetical protein|nr:hypothetical protein [Spirochaetaceae bacterium]
MAKLQFKKEYFFSPPAIFIFYITGSFLVLMTFRFFFPAEPAPLAIHSLSWRLFLGLNEYIGLFPALVWSALVIPFGLKAGGNSGETFRESPAAGFSPLFLDMMKGPIITAIAAAAIYGALFFLVDPLTEERLADSRFRGRLFRESAEQAEICMGEEAWNEAAQFIAVCEGIWPQSPVTEKVKQEVLIKLEEIRLSPDAEPEGKTPESVPAYGPGYLPQPERRTPVSAAEALELAEQALREERYYDAHWLATLAGRLAREGSAERVNAARLASRAWNGVTSLEPNIRERQRYDLYHIKQSGYGAMIAEDWISAYYIFLELSPLSPGDPDIANFLALSEREIGEIAFFTDEMDMAVGDILTEAVFSLPRKSPGGQPDGRLVLRLGSLSVFSDVSYGLDLECMAFDRNGRLAYRLEAPYVKIIPKTLDSEARLVVMMRALDRRDRGKRWEPVWSGSERSGIGNAQILLDLSYEEYLLLSQVRRGVDNLYIRDLFTAANTLGPFGFIPQVFQAEIVRRIAEPVLFLPLAIAAIIIGWRLRAKKRPRYLGIPMLGILPLVLNGLAQVFRAAVSTLGIGLVLALGFSPAIVLIAAGGVVFFLLSLILLAAQHG